MFPLGSSCYGQPWLEAEGGEFGFGLCLLSLTLLLCSKWTVGVKADSEGEE